MSAWLIAQGFRLRDPEKVCHAANFQVQQRWQSSKTSVLLALSECAAWVRDHAQFTRLTDELLKRPDFEQQDRDYLDDLRLLRSGDLAASTLPQHGRPPWSRIPWICMVYSLETMARSGENLNTPENRTFLSDTLSWIPEWRVEERQALSDLMPEKSAS
ncbi:hypothetical protein C7S18_14660 [Ahniella affigens]|uniref:Uncharacterized protein n=1 Tax=Ahniella affigens TaxID=2021234 RepID=A0A2P1PU32_9GAMM|nr:hypothetical protein [Ahniella affigens]AVP98353.1 hypothetical protein C7S18_14660 [Ahniella affigens]